MREVIYYPTFEVANENWLKFALLYLDKLNPIIPYAGDVYLSDRFQRLLNETDLIHVHRPDDSEGYPATLDAIEHIEKILKNPERYQETFSNRNVVQVWRNPKMQTARLFREKYTYTWEDFCRKEKLGRPTAEGLCLPGDLVGLYMTLLAHAIAEARGMSPITDQSWLDRFAVFTRGSDPGDAGVMTAQAVIRLHLPADLNEISIESVVRHRNRPGFRERQNAFHDELNKFLAETEKRGEPGEFSRGLGSAWSDFSDDIVKIGAGAATFGLGVWLLLGSGGIALPAALKEAVGGVSLVAGSFISVRATWRNTRSTRWTRKYLADLKQLKTSAELT